MQQVSTLPGINLHRGLKDRHIQLIALGGIIGSCYFLGTGAVIATVGPSVCLAYLLGGLIVYLVMQCMGELAVAMPCSGSFISYAARFISPTFACSVGWAYWLNWVIYIPAECVAAGLIMQALTGMEAHMWAMLFGLVVTLINLSHVKIFGEVEFWLALIKIFALITFSVVAVLLFFDVIHHSNNHYHMSWDYLQEQGGLFPHGGISFLTAMVLLLVNYQGTEIVGLVAGESTNPERAIPRAIRGVTYRILGLYIVPVFCLMLIFPWQNAGLSNSVFSDALTLYDLHGAGVIMSFVTLTAALSSANSGFYSSVRALHALSQEGMAPAQFGKLSKNQIPKNSVLMGLIAIWVLLLIGYFFSETKMYVTLLLISGFTGTMCWIALCWAQINFRREHTALGKSISDLTFKALGGTYSARIAITLMTLCLMLLFFNPDKSYKIAFILGCFSLSIPPLIYKIVKYFQKHKANLSINLTEHNINTGNDSN